MTDPKVNIKIGAQVRVRPEEEIRDHDWVIGDMLKFCGKTLTVVDYEIEKDCVTYLVAETDYGWDVRSNRLEISRRTWLICMKRKTMTMVIHSASHIPSLV